MYTALCEIVKRLEMKIYRKYTTWHSYLVLLDLLQLLKLSCCIKKPTLCIDGNQGADHLCSNLFHYTDTAPFTRVCSLSIQVNLVCSLEFVV